MYSKNPLFDLRGTLNQKTDLILQIAGAALVLVLWWILSILATSANITQMDSMELDGKQVVIEDPTYYENDSLLVAHSDRLLALNETGLRRLGLKRIQATNLPDPVTVLKAIPEMFFRDRLMPNIFKSIKLNIYGYIIAIAVSLIVGFSIGLIPMFRGLFSRILDAGRFIPLTAVTGIFILWFGIGNEMKVLFLAFGILVYLIPVVVQRIDEVQSVYLHTVYTLGASAWQTLRSVYLPYVLGKLIDDVRVLTAISWTYITIAEMLNKSGGIGELIWEAKRQSRIDKAFAVLLIIVLIGIVQDRIFVILNQVLFPYKLTESQKK
jgi:NitT/TauT family transport system permease protein